MEKLYINSNTGNIESAHFIYKLTCIACPEQYDVFHKDSGEMAAYIRLRHSKLTVDCPDCGGDLVYDCEYEEREKGCFDGDEERLMELSQIDAVLCNYYQKE